ncbi:uncharacterized protein LOC110831607 [Zootermopsis nevadensis]|uniref:Uncharacterized protein n=1 Tax=Zootermopsis nevadensis TaxID=136037 RepID=A0A067R5M4_ZOONE|nr:uncharacterized protein LOC110831607 [Zootermopsis nevadensis]KDR17595.1 hypothetical protein L798_08525 [Zootermopsis nevadensis]
MYSQTQGEISPTQLDTMTRELLMKNISALKVEAGFRHIENGTRSGEQTGNDRVSDAFEIIKEENLSAEGRVYRRKKKMKEEDKLEKVEKDYLKACRQLKVL